MADFRITRGGSWVSIPWDCRSACRYDHHFDHRIEYVGFRVCCSLQGNNHPINSIINSTINLTTMTTINMLAIPAGTFEMGSAMSPSEQPVHPVSLEAFSMSETLITQAQWRAVAQWKPRDGECWGMELDPDPSHFKGDDLPVECVNWKEAMEFCNRISQRTGRHYTLPSEAQWEYACRAGSTTKYPWGDEITHENANFWDSHHSTTPVGSYPPNAWGLRDMIGNVWEWIRDRWHSNYDGAPTDGSAWE